MFKCLRKLDGLLVLAVRNDYTYFEDKKNMIEIYRFGYLFSLTNIIIFIGTLYFTYH